ncbi:MAG: c-type cytochrome biogenesis protein CcmI [Betaproteobacteria bacterium]|nr:c-type cytochrome biogenesis protein CcmI [Betaproteobacteria bacterium]
MTAFLIAAILLILLPVALLFPVFLKRRNIPARSLAADRNLHVLREQLADLERERAAGLLSDSDFEEARTDLERRLIEENAPEQADTGAVVSGQSSPFAAVLLTLLLVVGGFSTYFWLGEPLALDERLVQTIERADPTPEQISAAIEQLQEHLKANPDDEEAWLNLALANQMIGHSAEAVAAYERIEASIGANPDLLTAYAEALATMAMPQQPDEKPAAFQGKPRRLLLEALKLEPEHPKALFLAGAAAFEAGDKQEAAVHWEKLLPYVEPGSEVQALLIANIERIRAEMPAGKR